MRNYKRTAIAVAVLGGVIAVAGCSSSGSGTPSSKSSGGSGASSITIGAWQPIDSQVISLPQAKAGVEAAIMDINAAGGVNGHPLKLDFCDTKQDPNGEVACAEQMVRDKVAAVVAPTFYTGTNKPFDILAQGKLAAIGTQGLSPAELSSKNVFPLSSGGPGWFMGEAALAVQLKATKVGEITDNSPSPLFATSLVTAGLKLAGIKPAASATVELNTADYSSAVAKATAGGINAVTVNVTPQDFPKAIQALRQANFAGKIITTSSIFPPATIKALGSAANGIYATSLVALPTDTSNPGIAQFQKDMKAYAAGQSVDELSLGPWAATMLTAKLLGTVKSYDASSVLDAIQNLSTPIDIKVIPPYAIKGRTSPLSDYPGLLQTSVVYAAVKNGALTAVGGFTDPFKQLGAK